MQTIPVADLHAPDLVDTVGRALTDIGFFAMPCFIHPREAADLTPLASCGSPRYPSITAGAYLEQRLQEIGL